nr:uncharacterized protein LOC109149952 [Ipomoea batatas]
MSINFKNYKFDILDGSSKRMTNERKYEEAPVDLLDMLSTYLDTKLQQGRAIRLRNMRPKRMQMAWRDPTPNADSGVLAMRHMEAFTGQECSKWQCGLQRGNAVQITNIRKRLMHNIILAEINAHTPAIVTRVRQYDSDRFSPHTRVSRGSF